jgi:phage gp46-like protein
VSSDRLINPETGDVQDAPGGGFVEDDELANQIIFSYSIELGTWEGDRTMGHRFAELARATDTPETQARLKDLAAEPVQWLLDLGLLSRIEVDVMTFGPGIVAFQPRCYAPSAKKPVAGIGLFKVSVGGG